MSRDLFSLLALYVDEEHASAEFKGVVGVYASAEFKGVVGVYGRLTVVGV